MTNEEEMHQLKTLVDDLCLVSSGWRTDAQHDAYTQAYNRICNHGWEVKKRAEIVQLKRRIEELEKST